MVESVDAVYLLVGVMSTVCLIGLCNLSPETGRTKPGFCLMCMLVCLGELGAGFMLYNLLRMNVDIGVFGSKELDNVVCVGLWLWSLKIAIKRLIRIWKEEECE